MSQWVIGTNCKTGDLLWTSGVLYMFSYEHKKKKKKKKTKLFFYCEDDWTLEEITQRVFGVSILGNILNISGCSPGWLALGGPVSTPGLYQSPETFCPQSSGDSVILWMPQCIFVLCWTWPGGAEATHGVGLWHHSPGYLAPSPEGLWHMLHSHWGSDCATRRQTHLDSLFLCLSGTVFPPQESHLYLLFKSVLEE